MRTFFPVLFSIFYFLISAVVFAGVVYAEDANQAPIFWSPRESELSVGVGEGLEFSVFASDPDLDILTYSAFNLPSAAVFNSETRTFAWHPATNQAGTFNVTFRVFDGRVTVDKVVKIAVGGTNIGAVPANANTIANPTAPVFVNFNPPPSVKESQLYIYTPQVASNIQPVVFRLVSGPAGLTVNPNLGTILWVPNFNQARTEPYPVAIAVSNGYLETTRSFSIFVEDANVSIAPTVSSPTKTVFIDREVPEKLKIYNPKVRVADNGDLIVNWETNKPATAQVIFDTVSQSEKNDNFTYANSTLEIKELTITHEVNLRRIQFNTPYYFRAVSKIEGTKEIATSGERIIVQLSDQSFYDLSLGSLFAVAKEFLSRPLILLLLAIAAVIAIIVYLRKKRYNL